MSIKQDGIQQQRYAGTLSRLIQFDNESIERLHKFINKGAGFEYKVGLHWHTASPADIERAKTTILQLQTRWTPEKINDVHVRMKESDERKEKRRNSKVVPFRIDEVQL